MRICRSYEFKRSTHRDEGFLEVKKLALAAVLASKLQDVAASCNNIGNVYHAQGEYDEAFCLCLS